MQEFVNQINQSNTFLRLLEVGAGIPIANEIFKYPNASKTIYSSESYYSRESFDLFLGVTPGFDSNKKIRSVSAERLSQINNKSSVKSEMSKGFYNTMMSTTFQVGDVENKISTHGWISINIKDNYTRYYHISLHAPKSRIEYINKIGEIGILLLHSKGEFIPKDCFVDIVLDENLNPVHEETLDFLANQSEDMISIFTFNNKIERMEYITRNIDYLVVYKGSFNPPSLSHKEIMESSLELFGGNKKGVFCLSYNTYEKGKQTTESFLHRIQLLNKLGWDVIVCSKPLFKNTYDFVRLKYEKKLIFPQGIDTLNRFAKDYIVDEKTFNKELYSKDFKNTNFLVYYRDGQCINSVVKCEMFDKKLVTIIGDTKHGGISSTKIRYYVNNSDFEKVKELVPKEIYEEIINKNY